MESSRPAICGVDGCSQALDPAVRGCDTSGIAAVKRAGKAAGTLTSDWGLAREYFAARRAVVAVGVDTSILVKAAAELARSSRVHSRGIAADACIDP